MKNANGIIGWVAGAVVSVALVYATVYYAGKGWKRSQSGEKLV